MGYGAQGHRDNKLTVPKEGTVTRQLFDFYIEHKTEWLTANQIIYELGFHKANLSNYRRALVDDYGLDIRSRKSGNAGRTATCLVGRYIGNEYIDYVEEKRKKAVDKQEAA